MEALNQKTNSFMLVQKGTIDELRRKLDHVAALLETSSAGAESGGEESGGEGEEYVEPGPHASRKYFTPSDLMQRWGWGKTKVYEIPEAELPYWKKGQLKRYFWAHVWAYEGRLAREEAERIHRQYQASPVSS